MHQHIFWHAQWDRFKIKISMSISDLDQANGHLVVKGTLEDAGVDEEECLSEILRIENGAAAGKVKLDGRIM